MLISDAFELFRTDYIALRGLSASTDENYSLAVLSFIRAVEDKSVNAINTSDLLTWRRWMEKRNKPGTIRVHMSKLKNILIFTNKRGLSSFDITDIHLPKLPPSLPKYLTADEIQLLIDTAVTARNKCLLSFLFTSGIRAGELCRLSKNDVQGDTVFIRQGKCNTARTVFISAYTQKLLAQYLQERTDSSDILFYSHKKGRLCTAAVNQLVKKIAKQSGIKKPVHTHMLRHSFATHLTRSGVDVTYTQRMMGHAFVSTTMQYIHLTNMDLQEAHARVFTDKMI